MIREIQAGSARRPGQPGPGHHDTRGQINLVDDDYREVARDALRWVAGAAVPAGPAAAAGLA